MLGAISTHNENFGLLLNSVMLLRFRGANLKRLTSLNDFKPGGNNFKY